MENKRWVLKTFDNGMDKTNYVHLPEISADPSIVHHLDFLVHLDFEK
ncbi:MAG: hypothetical protein RR854_07025 [Muribaculaceae bacterium]